MKTFKYILGITLAVVVVAISLAFTLIASKKPAAKSDDYQVLQKWRLPNVLEEVSGIAWLEDGRIACIQDEDGTIFIYDLDKGQIIEKIAFAGSGDYEGIAVHHEDAYVMRSDGLIFEIKRFRESGKMAITSFQTDFSRKNNMETLAMSADQKRLITAPKDRDKADDFKGVYSIDVLSKSMESEPSVRISMKDDALKQYYRKKAYRTFSPSDMAVNPSNGDLYVIEGIKPKLILLSAGGKIKRVIPLHDKDFPQPEGITFSPNGDLYISNEGRNGVATIVKLEIN
jgi:uncharacterized protein YjiK